MNKRGSAYLLVLYNTNTADRYTVYGAPKTIPGGADILVAGFSCKDYSRLNQHPKGFGEAGESFGTFSGVMSYMYHHRPPLVILENVLGCPWTKVSEFIRSQGYRVVVTKPDTKEYYIPQTRQRGYLFAIDNKRWEKVKPKVPHPAPEESFCSLMDRFKRPCSSTFLDFIFRDDDYRLLRTKKTLAQAVEKDKPHKAVDWVRGKARYTTYRSNYKLGTLRPLTNWHDNGTCTTPDFFWKSWAKTQVERIWDTLDIRYLLGLIRGYDLLYKT